MRLINRLCVVLFFLLTATQTLAQSLQNKPGLEPYIPNRIEWLALLLNSDLRRDFSAESPFSLNIVNSDHETILIFVRYDRNVDRRIMNMSIETAREVAQITAKSYGWSNWVKIKERVELAKPEK